MKTLLTIVAVLALTACGMEPTEDHAAKGVIDGLGEPVETRYPLTIDNETDTTLTFSRLWEGRPRPSNP